MCRNTVNRKKKIKNAKGYVKRKKEVKTAKRKCRKKCRGKYRNG